ncbi:glycoside hydrolase domain-containing protein [Aestuariibaculum suncheonense]|uniref:DUF4091 domain-containing protein n=1 Tax=Aestuariibaculum suncheonense TaxID=1028745 RepID=A0A8J6Q6X9_9FLAO|nr:glycoside hydrolase domain-containing protein [Aestuariibaculum suncheonense]MBD0835402.1 DUF4091 domain-containing protein [Aestuariibaculum suncheonense]
MKKFTFRRKTKALLWHKALLVFILLPVFGLAQVKTVWALGDGEKIFRSELNHPNKIKNFTWDGEKIRLKGLYNEVLAFQVIVESGSEDAKNVELSVDAPLHKLSGKQIGNNTLKYGIGGTIEVFVQHYLHVDTPTLPQWFYGSAASAPKEMTGWIPDALVPTDALPNHEGYPVSIPSNSNQGFWIDVHLPRDQKRYPDGLYTGMVQVMEQGKIIKEIPLEITLLPHYLPDENHTNIWLFTSDVHKYYPEMSSQQVDNMLKFEGHRHRIDVVGGFEVNALPFNQETMDAYKPYLNGDAFTAAKGYHGPGQGAGEKLFPVGMYGSPVLGTNKADVQKQSDLWVEWFDKNAPDVKYFWYMIDEPQPDSYAWIKERAGWIKSNPGKGKLLSTFTTTPYKLELDGAIDIWAGNDGLDLKELPAIRKRDGDHWFYNGNRPRYGSVILEGTAVDFRVNSWILYKYDVNMHFIWHGTHWDHNRQGPKRHLHQNVFKNPLTFIGETMEFGNGDGILFYPGHMPFYPKEERGLNQLLPSIRLKNIRRGQQDALIMSMVEQKSGKGNVINIINSVVPKALSEVSMDETVPWSQSGDSYDKVREQLLGLIE